MRNLIFILILLGASFYPTKGLSETVSLETIEVIKNTAMKLQPKLTEEQASELADELAYGSELLELRWEILLSILFQESSLQLDPHDCARKKFNCKDFGIAQINYRTWGKELNLNKSKLTKDMRYSLRVMFQVLSRYKVKYAKKELNWYTRYHSATHSFRSNYMQALNKQYERVNRAAEPESYALGGL